MVNVVVALKLPELEKEESCLLLLKVIIVQNWLILSENENDIDSIAKVG